MPERTGYLGLGSNVGDSEGHLRAALQLLDVIEALKVSDSGNLFDFEGKEIPF